ncbi:virion structural protein [Bacillus phage 0305phi8-36]|uniref:virion structural protein n=1 Tax=Bacillus phage 0305phi8-36 TaxID=458639 RepID=UPI00015A1F1E|nr:virion structural protein [Bacillus phage 0305phi8-36]ABS83732.1 virion structural protein [Bacillus phage 0305phi8-36]
MKYPEIVKTNARYRGPRESRKQSNSKRDIEASLSVLRKELSVRRKVGEELRKDMFTLYNETIPRQRTEVINGVLSVKGGELQ